MFCKECGEENRNDRKFCSNCGTELTDYTKPREDLIMPDEIKKEQEVVAHNSKVSNIFNIVVAIILTLAIAFTLASFLVPKPLLMGFAITCVVFYVLYFSLRISKKIVMKKISKN